MHSFNKYLIVVTDKRDIEVNETFLLKDRKPTQMHRKEETACNMISRGEKGFLCLHAEPMILLQMEGASPSS